MCLYCSYTSVDIIIIIIIIMLKGQRESSYILFLSIKAMNQTSVKRYSLKHQAVSSFRQLDCTDSFTQYLPLCWSQLSTI